MRRSSVLAAIAAFAIAALLAAAAAFALARVVENRTAAAVNELFRTTGLAWASATTDGLEVHLAGTAPDEAQRFRAMHLTGTLVDAGRIRDDMAVVPAEDIAAPRFSVELLRNDEGISLIGLVPGEAGQRELAEAVEAIADGVPVADMMTRADYLAPVGWQQALDYGLAALDLLPRAKISIAADAVTITAIAGSEAEKRRFETELARSRPEGIAVTFDISAPRPVLTPFTLRFVKDDAGARFDACAADTEAARETILAAAAAAGVAGQTSCTIALGVPTPSWAAATAAGIRAVDALGGGTITFADADVTLLAAMDTPQATFDRVVGELGAALPEVFSLQATLPEKPKADAPPEGPPEFTATLSPEGRVELRGRLTDEAQRDAVTSFARARFGADEVYQATRLDPDLPDGWPVRVLAGLAVLSELHDGQVKVQADLVEVTGVTGSTDAQAAISRVLSAQLGKGQAYKVNLRYDEKLDPLAALPTPQECVADLNGVLAVTKIPFGPGSAEIEAAANGTLNQLADILRRCMDIPMEIGGYTDSQGSESGNLALSQARAEAVLLGLQGRRVLVGALSAVGHGEADPIADNATEAGREANRRIEFTLVQFDDPQAGAAAPAAADGPGDAPLAQIPVGTAPVNADPDAPGAQRPERRPDSAPDSIDETPAEVLPGFGNPQRGAVEPGPAETDTAAAEIEAPSGDATADAGFGTMDAVQTADAEFAALDAVPVQADGAAPAPETTTPAQTVDAGAAVPGAAEAAMAGSGSPEAAAPGVTAPETGLAAPEASATSEPLAAPDTLAARAHEPAPARPVTSRPAAAAAPAAPARAAVTVSSASDQPGSGASSASSSPPPGN